MNVTIFIVGFGGIYIFLKIIGFFDDDDTVPPQKVSPNISSTSYSNNKNSRSKETFQNSSPSTATKSSDELSECIDALLLQNFRLALDTVLNSLKDLLSNFKEVLHYFRILLPDSFFIRSRSIENQLLSRSIKCKDCQRSHQHLHTK